MAANILFPGWVLAGAPFKWYIYRAAGVAWTATYFKNGVQSMQKNGVVDANGAAVITSDPLALGTDWEVAIDCSDGSYLRVPVHATAEATFRWQADYGAQLPKTPKLNEATFGDGYTQRAPVGLNHNLETWDLNFTEVPVSEATQIILFLDSMGGYRSFAWVNPDGRKLRFTCGDYARTYIDNNTATVRAKFAQTIL